MNKTILLEARSLYKDLSNGEKTFPILHNVNFQIHEGEWVSLVGPSGSGKTTLLGLLAGMDRPSSGSVFLDGQEISKLPEAKLSAIRNQKIGMVFQHFFLIKDLTALENTAAPLYIRKDIKDPHEQAAQLLNSVGLANRLSNLPKQLSGGEQQRVAIARAIVGQPKILFADEPTGNLDAKSGEQVLEVLKSLQRSLGLTILMVTHNPAIAEMADRKLHLYDGRLVENFGLSPNPFLGQTPQTQVNMAGLS